MLNNKKENKRLPMPGKVKKGFRCYCTLVITTVLLGCCSMTAFAVDDPLTVVNNLSEFIFGLIRAVGLISWAGVLSKWASLSRATTLPSGPTVSSLWRAASSSPLPKRF